MDGLPEPVGRDLKDALLSHVLRATHLPQWRSGPSGCRRDVERLAIGVHHDEGGRADETATPPMARGSIPAWASTAWVRRQHACQ